MQTVYIIDNVGDTIMLAQLKEEHFVQMCARSWILPNKWIKPDTEVPAMNHENLIKFINEAAL